MSFIDSPFVDVHVCWQTRFPRSCRSTGQRLPALLFLTLFLLGLAGCGGDGSHGYADRPPSNRTALVAWQEWTRFGRSTVVYGGAANGYTNRAGMNEHSEPLNSRVGDYWGSCGHPEWNGHTSSRPWSGAFVSWVMANAGVSQRDFPSNGRHGGYLASLYERQRGGGFALHAPQDYSPKAGDLVCAGTAGASWRNADAHTAKKRIDSTAAHCDVVVDVRGGYVHAVGGNVKNSVSMSLYPVDSSGRLAAVPGRPWMLVAQNKAY